METTEKKTEQLSPAREALEIDLKKVEINQRQQDLAAGKLIDELEVERRKIINDQERMEALDYLLAVAKISIIDNDKTNLSEAVFKSIWEQDELEEIKSLIMNKIRKL